MELQLLLCGLPSLDCPKREGIVLKFGNCLRDVLDDHEPPVNPSHGKATAMEGWIDGDVEGRMERFGMRSNIIIPVPRPGGARLHVIKPPLSSF
jgi:hypothetical protein